MIHSITREHLGGNKTFVMLGAKNFVNGQNHLQFDIGTGARNKANRVIVTLQPDDLYSITLYRIWGLKFTELEKVSNIFCDNLQTRLGQMLEMETRL
jgi:hypothetical protein